MKYLIGLAFDQSVFINPVSLDASYLVKIAINNRMEGFLYNELNRLELMNKEEFVEVVNKVKKYTEKNIKLIEMLKDVSTLLRRENVDFSVLKGGYLLKEAYKKINERKMSDIDILVHKKDITKITDLLLDFGFVQGKYCKDLHRIIEFSKEEIMRKTLFTHELAEFIIRIENHFLNLDVNFCFSWNGHEGYNLPNITTGQALMEKHKFFVDGIILNTMNPILNLFHLCVHLYNEAQFFVHDNISVKGDLRLIRFVDVVRLIELHNIEPMELMDLAEQLNVKIQFCYVLRILKDLHPSYRHIVVNDFDDKELFKYYLSNGEERFWTISPYDRMFDLDLKSKAVTQLEIF